MSYNPNIPQATDYIDESQPQLLANFQQLNTLYDGDHYAFNDGTGNAGLHQKVTSPDQTAHPTTTTNPVFYGYQPSANVGIIQWSRGPSDAVPTPLTALHGNVATLTGGSGSPATILNFSGLADCLATLTLTGVFNSVKFLRSTSIAFDGSEIITTLGSIPWAYQLAGQSNWVIIQISGSTTLQIYSSGTATDVVWSLKFDRLEV